MNVTRKHTPAIEEGRRAAGHGRGRHDGPSHAESVYEPRDGHGGGIADHRRECADEGEQPDEDPAGGKLTPCFCDGAEPRRRYGGSRLRARMPRTKATMPAAATRSWRKRGELGEEA